LAQLRSKGVLILGSGNIVHNLRAVDWLKINAVDYGYDWAVAAQQRINSFILDRNYQALVDYDKLGADVLQSIPTPEHYLPLLYSLAATEADDDLSVFNDHLLAGSLSMTSLLYA
jgi:4,5-DOPA dioxygenase extradiol